MSEDAVTAAIQQMKEEERRRKEERKRKREEEESWARMVRGKLDQEAEKIDKYEQSTHDSNRELYALFNDLQCISHDFGIQFETPELVVVGMQSDGKSSFIEALLGFQFNIVETNIGTRRPLILQMINNPERDIPNCRFRRENAYNEGEAGQQAVEADTWEPRDTPIEDLVHEIVRRTNEKAGRGEHVSAAPIILRVEYAHCANLTIYDTPGFRLGGDEKLRADIQRMVERLMQPANRIIVCLEQSTVEWANTSSRPIVRRFDPTFSRTVLVNTKFDNRVKELRTPESAAKYLMGENLPEGKKPFFISLPVRRNLDSERFRDGIKECYLDDFRRLLEIKFQEQDFAEQVGFHRVKAYLERMLTEKYYASVPPTLHMLDNICKESERELQMVRRELESNNLELLRNKVNRYVQSFILLIERLLEGSIIGSPDTFGETLQEEKAASGIGEWPAHGIEYDIQNSHYKIYGGAQYERLLNEFEYVAHSKEFPFISIHEVASAIGTSKYHNVPVFETAASDIVQIKARKELQPLIDVVLARCSYVFKRLCDVGISVMKGGESGVLNVYEPFIKELRAVYGGFIDSVEELCRSKLMDDFETFTKILDWDLLTGLSDLGKEYDYLARDAAQTHERVTQMMQRNEGSAMNIEGSRSRRIGESAYNQVCTMSARLFAGIRFFFVKYVRNKLNAFFLDPMFQRLGGEVTDHFRKLTDDRFSELFALGAVELKERAVMLENQLVHCTASRDRFKEVYQRLLSRADN